MADAVTWISAVGAALSGFATIGIVVVAARASRELNPSQRLEHATPTLHARYVDRPIDPPIPVNGRKYTVLRPARVAWYQMRDKAQRAGDGDFLHAFASASGTRDPTRWQNRLAYECSLAVQELGMLCFSGALPLDYVLAGHYGTISEDWETGRALVDEIRVEERKPGARVHGEWLAILAVAYRASINDSEAKRFLRAWDSPEKAFQRLRSIERVGRTICPSHVRRRSRQLVRAARRRL